MWQNINRHVLVVWHSFGVLASAFAFFSLVQKNVLTLDVAVSLIILIAAWLVAHIFDANGWYSRNLLIITNIERQFLTEQDLSAVHYFFGSQKENTGLIGHMQVQLWFSIGIAGSVLMYHFNARILPVLRSTANSIDLGRLSPYILVIMAIFLLRRFWIEQEKSYKALLEKSPGIRVEDDAELSILV